MDERQDRSYSGEMMKKGSENEEIVLRWLEKNAKEVTDLREFRVTQRMDIDFGIETIDGAILLAEVKSDKWISEAGNMCFENNRINHYVKDKWFYLGWGWRSPAQKLIVRNPGTGETFLFDFSGLRKSVGEFVSKSGSKLRINVTPTDKVKTTINFLIPMQALRSTYKKFIVSPPESTIEAAA